jgi:hypothetical protein
MLSRVELSLTHLGVLHSVFSDKSNYDQSQKLIFESYQQNETELIKALSDLGFEQQLYATKRRQMILADIFEYIFLGRIYYSVKTREQRSQFIRAILHFCNMLMCYEAMTVSGGLRRKFLKELKRAIKEVGGEPLYQSLYDFKGSVGLKEGESDAPGNLNDYFDTLLPKTAGGLWHELVLYIFLLRNDCGYIVPLLLSQKLLGLSDHLVPPDFLVITKDKRLYGIEVGMKKEIQSGWFSLKTAIPTATVDTINSRVSDRCPICKKWITFCPYVIDHYSNLSEVVENDEVRCLDMCDKFRKEEILAGKCPHTKYSRRKAKTRSFTLHEFADGRHYHYQCILANVKASIKESLRKGDDPKSLKTHFPYYGGLEGLIVEPPNPTTQTNPAAS